MVACPEEIAYKNGWIDKSILQKSIEKLKGTRYAEYLYGMFSDATA